MLAKIKSCAVIGLEGAIVEVEVDISPGLPSFNIVGLPDAAVQEARERVRAAIRNSAANFPIKRITVNLAPASLKKAGPAYDLPIAVGILLSSEQVTTDLRKTMLLGELSLDGSLRHTNGILSMVALARERNIENIIVPRIDADEASLIEGTNVMPFNSLTEIISYLRGETSQPVFTPNGKHEEFLPAAITDFAEIKGQEHVKRALEVAAAGGHNIIMTGTPGSGKTMLARALPAILPEMSTSEAIEVTKIYSISGLLSKKTAIIRQRPFRAPHYTISHAALVGGGHWPRPGEISLSHRGVLFLDELPEFGRSVLEVLRQPLEDKIITISRAQGSATFPANFMLVGAMNPCPCGYYGDTFKQCTCSSGAIVRYQKRLSGPLLDRIDIFVDVPRVDYEKLTTTQKGEKSAVIRSRVSQARELQQQRLANTGSLTNSDMTTAMIRQHCLLEESARSLLKTAMKQLYLSARGFHRILKVARTIADLDNSQIIRTNHVAEAIQYRQKI